MPRKSIKQSDDEGVAGVEAPEGSRELVSETGAQPTPDGKGNHRAPGDAANDNMETSAQGEPEASSVVESRDTAASAEPVTPAEENISSADSATTPPSKRAEAAEDVLMQENEARSAGVFPLEIDHEIEVTPEEAMATGWPGAPAFGAETDEAKFFPVEMSDERTVAIGRADEQMPGELIGAVELAAQDTPSAAEESAEKSERAASDTPLAEAVWAHPIDSSGPVSRDSAGESAELPGAVELASDPASGKQEGSEIIGPIELAQFFASESAADPASMIGQTPTPAVETATAQGAERKHLVRSAALVSIGNLGSSLLGMVRQIVVTSRGNAIAAPFNAALAPVNNFYQLLVNGSTDGALIPVFNDYAAPEKRQEMRRVVFSVVNLILIIAIVTSIGYLLISPWFVDALVSGYKGADKNLTLQYSQIIFFSLVVLGPFAVLLAALFALKTFGWPAFATASYHTGIILGALVFALVGNQIWGPIMLPVGLLIGAAGQIVLLLPGIRSRKLYYMFVLDLKHPALKRIYHLYWPIAISYVFSMALVFLDLHLQSLTPQHAAATTAMATATTLIQFPIGLVAQALSVAVLPTLSEHAREGNSERFKEALLLGIRLGLLLMIPAMTGLLVLRTPIVYVIFAHHNYSLSDANLSALALQNYAYQLPFVALDQLLIAAFYARKNTKIPVIIGIVSMLFYLVVALPFYSNIGVAALAFANTVQNSSHALILLVLLRLAIGSLHIRRTIPAILKICLAAAIMGVVAWGALVLLAPISLFSLNHLLGQLLTLLIAGGLAVAVYVGAILLLKVEEIHLVRRAVLAKLGKK